MPGSVHVIGAGLAGLAAAVQLAKHGTSILVHEAATQAGGRCRSYLDPALGLVIDNGNHLLLSANRAALSYLDTIGAAEGLVGPASADYAFVDLASGERWTLRINDGRLPWWVLDPRRRVPGTTARDYVALLRLVGASSGKTICEVVTCAGTLYRRLARPLLLAALNTDPKEASAGLAGAVVRETLVAGGRSCRPLVAKAGLGPVFIEPALRFLRRHGAKIGLGRRLRALSLSHDRITALDFGDEQVEVGTQDAVILAVPPVAAADLVPGLTAPSEFRAIVNAHFRIPPPAGLAPVMGVINGTSEWLFAFADRLSVTISAADRLLDAPREQLARNIWDEVSVAAGLSQPMPPWQIVRERRATFAATPEQDGKRPRAETAWTNLVLAGDWTQTGLPATIEGAIRSGNTAAGLVVARGG
ncbi:MAG TPA: hydroxysqualene dehydroxylase HpnE [Xanthobacteraceae bacterium]|jgi:squalene-associated FAD-dependent desaturase